MCTTLKALAYLSVLLPVTAVAQSHLDGVVEIDTVNVVDSRFTSALKGVSSGLIRWDVSSFETLPQMLGMANPLSTVQMLPGVQSTTEYDAGLYINGCNNAHNTIQIENVTVYNPTHLFGLNSTFITSHFSDFLFLGESPMTLASNRLGGYLNMKARTPHHSQKKCRGELSLGLISSQGTVNCLLGSHSDISVSARSSYIDFLYGRWLEVDAMSLKYNFQDFNLTYNIYHDDRHLVRLNAFMSNDNLALDENDFLDSKMRWGNRLSSLEYVFSNERITSNLTAYYTGYGSNVRMDYDNRGLEIPSEIESVGLSESLSFSDFTVGVDAGAHRISPQAPIVTLFHDGTETSPKTVQQSVEMGAFASYSTDLTTSLQMTATVKLTAYRLKDDICETNADGQLDFTYTAASGLYSIKAGRKHQYLNQTGFSSIGFPTEFWFSSSGEFRPQYAHFISLSHYTDFLAGMYSISSQLYFKRLHNQTEYLGNAYDLFDGDYDLADYLYRTEGYNVGLNVILNKQSGALTGWISYSLGRAMRWFKGDRDYTFPSSHERIQELNCCINGRINERWSVGGTFTLATGTPFTAPDYFYLMNGRILTNFSNYNSCRLPKFSRLDLSCLYRIPPKAESRLSQSVNFSIYNALAATNVCMYKLKIYKGKYGYSQMSFLNFPLPSVSYTLKF